MRYRYIWALFTVLIVTSGLYIFDSAWYAIGFYHAFMITAILSSQPLRFRILGAGWDLTGLVLLSLLAVLSGIMLYILWPVINNNIAMGHVLVELGLGQNFKIFAIYYVLTTPIFEEYYWRYLLAPTDVGLDFTELAFAGYHVLVMMKFVQPYWALLVLPVLAITAWLWRVCRQKYKGLIIPLISHYFADLSIIIAAFLLIN